MRGGNLSRLAMVLAGIAVGLAGCTGCDDPQMTGDGGTGGGATGGGNTGGGNTGGGTVTGGGTGGGTACTTGQVTAITANGSNGSQVLNAMVWPIDSDLSVQVSVTADCDVPVRLRLNGSTGTELGTATSSSGTVTFTLPPNVIPQDDGTLTFYAEAVVNGNAVGGLPQAFTVLRHFAGACSIDGLAARGAGADADTTTPGYQIAVSGSIEAGSTGEVAVGTLGTATISASTNTAFSGSVTITPPTDAVVTVPVTLTCTDASGATKSDTFMLTLDFERPVLNTASPVLTSCTSQLTEYSVEVTVAVTGAEMQTVSFTAHKVGETATVSVGAQVVTNGTATTNLTFPTNGTWIVTATVSDEFGNTRVVTFSTCADGGFGGITVNSPACDFSFTVPSTNPATVLANQAPGGNYTLTAHSAACTNTAVTFTTNGGMSQSGTTNAMGNVSFTVPATTGTTATYAACITNTGGLPPTCNSVIVTYQLTLPTFVSPNAAAMPLNIVRDGNQSLAGIQTTLTFNAPAGVPAYICSNQTPAPTGATPCPDGSIGYWQLAGGPTFSSPSNNFTFPDGTYNITLVVGSTGTGFQTSDPLAVTADSVRPCIATTLTINGDANGDMALNAAELNASTPPSVAFTLGCGDAPADIASVSWTSSCGNTAHSQAAGVRNTGTAYTVDLQRSTFPTPVQQSYQFGLKLTDSHGNTNVLCGTTPAPNPNVLFWLLLDDTIPACTISAPVTNSTFNISGDADTATAGYQVNVSVDTSSDVTTPAVVITGASQAPTAGTAARTGDRVTTPYTFTATGTDTVSFAATCTDAVGNVGTATTQSNVLLDRDAPTCTLVDPANNTLSSTFANATRVDTTGAVGQTVTVRSGMTDIGTLTVNASGTAQGSLSYPAGAQSITATVSDTAGNTCTTSANLITVNATGCSLVASSPTTTITTQNSTPTGPTTASVIVSATSGNCTTGQAVQLFQTQPGPRTLLQSGMVNGSGVASFTVSVTDGQSVGYEIVINNGTGILTTATIGPFDVNISGPTVGSVTPNAANLFVVNASNTNAASNPAYVVDSVAGAPGDITFTVNNVVGANGGNARVRLTGNNTVVGTANISTSPANVSIAAAFPQKLSGAAYVIEITDADGNVTTAFSGSVTVDVLAPGTPGITPSFAATGDSRIGKVTLSVTTPTYDDGTDAASGPHSGYELRWTTVLAWSQGVNGGNPCLQTAQDYANSAFSNAGGTIAHGTTSQVVNLPPANRYCIGVVARDAVGNVSTYVAPTVFNNDAREDVLTNPTGVASQEYGLMLAAGGSLNNDAVDDLVVGFGRRAVADGGAAIANIGGVYVYYGSTGFTANGGCDGGSCTEILPPDTLGAGRFGSALAVGDVGGPNAKPDLIVGSSFYNGSRGRAFLYFGSATAAAIDTTTFVEFDGQLAGGRLGEGVAIIPGRSGQTLLALTAPGEGAAGLNQGRVYIYRNRDLAGWNALKTGSVVIVSSTTADWVIDGPTPINGNYPLPSAGNQFGRARGGISGIPDINGDSIPDLAISMAKVDPDAGDRVYVYAGREVQDAGVTTTSSSTVVREIFDPTFNSGNLGFVTGLGLRLIGTQLYGATSGDLVVTRADTAVAYIYKDGNFTAPAQTIQGIQANAFGTWGSASDFNNDGKPDVTIGEGATTNGSAWVYYQYPVDNFDQGTIGFWMSRFQGSANKGVCTAVGDFDGDGVVDLAMGESLNASGKVFVWH